MERERGKQSASETERELKQSIPIAKSAKCQGFFFCRLFFLAHFYAVYGESEGRERGEDGDCSSAIPMGHNCHTQLIGRRLSMLGLHELESVVTFPSLATQRTTHTTPPLPKGKTLWGSGEKNEANVCLGVERKGRGGGGFGEL